ncbi:MAG: D-glycero-beta-D-manno-heptose 1-phosphate adenylyltransferase [Proteobacteria bacterium]|nr:D-glycero-beta-D-manno-heptose 1-phosphate adenylyltransferase [Pseudomonadota bacterium]MBU4287132.1 D-glycero-beta-D-manno-heptose 1-phosphate adenylyltransferase [Pseudomonadota bacterium]MBU4415460.1 D-glycero-beta-D-manno-heptose 1-phosphate adenylyltransferase [Pseudomonadota bacterium]
MHTMSKIITLKDLLEKIRLLRKQGKKIVFTNGCFDIMHVGHVRYLSKAKAKGKILVVGLNSDKSVNTIKGGKRPIICEDQRAEVLASLWCVDYIIVFNEPDPLKLIQAIKPDVLVKGADWSEDKIIGADFVKKNGGQVVRVPLVPEISTSSIMHKILEIYR